MTLFFFGAELLDEYWNLYSKLKFTKKDMKQIIINSFDDSFLSEEEKTRFKEAIENKWKN